MVHRRATTSNKQTLNLLRDKGTIRDVVRALAVDKGAVATNLVVKVDRVACHGNNIVSLACFEQILAGKYILTNNYSGLADACKWRYGLNPRILKARDILLKVTSNIVHLTTALALNGCIACRVGSVTTRHAGHIYPQLVILKTRHKDSAGNGNVKALRDGVAKLVAVAHHSKVTLAELLWWHNVHTVNI